MTNTHITHNIPPLTLTSIYSRHCWAWLTYGTLPTNHDLPRAWNKWLPCCTFWNSSNNHGILSPTFNVLVSVQKLRNIEKMCNTTSHMKVIVLTLFMIAACINYANETYRLYAMWSTLVLKLGIPDRIKVSIMRDLKFPQRWWQNTVKPLTLHLTLSSTRRPVTKYSDSTTYIRVPFRGTLGKSNLT